MASTDIKLTYQDYLELPDDANVYEIIEGELMIAPAPNPRHQRISYRLTLALGPYVDVNGMGELFYAPFAVILDEHTIIVPDLVFVAAGERGRMSERGLEGPPTLIVEILSPSTARKDRVRKRQTYAKFGVPWYWLVDPDAHAIEALGLHAGEYQVAGRLEGDAPTALPPFAGLVLDPAAIWV